MHPCQMPSGPTRDAFGTPEIPQIDQVCHVCYSLVCNPRSGKVECVQLIKMDNMADMFVCYSSVCKLDNT